ncbi:DUF3267 domain-containing protein [uncultured Clostridium sp.]|uniref:DUF3267 domain-containing protein n=1 Tax=uncultured Clostridium sp. TaxID=59620 RepID=UPI00345188B3
MIITSDYPNFSEEISDDYILKALDNNSLKQQKKYSYLIMSIIHYVLSFYLGYNLFYFGDKFTISIIYFLIYIVLIITLVVLVHTCLHCVLFPYNTWSNSCYIGISFKHMTPFCYCKKELKRWRLILSTIFPFIFLTVIPFTFYIYTPTNMLLYSIVYCNSILSAFDIYNFYILTFKQISQRNLLIKSNNKFYLINKK